MHSTASDHETVGRTLLGRVLPLALLCAACVFFAAAVVLPDDEANAPKIGLLIAAGVLSAVAAVVVEMDVQSELRLAQTGSVAEATVSEVHLHHRRNGNDHGWMRYWFATADGQSIEKTARLGYYEPAYLVAGSKIQVIYDPTRPRRCRPVERLWAVERA